MLVADEHGLAEDLGESCLYCGQQLEGRVVNGLHEECVEALENACTLAETRPKDQNR